MTVPAKRSGEPGWRRRWIFAGIVLGFTAWRLTALEHAADTQVNQTIAWGYILLGITVILGMMGFATAQDIAAIVATRSGLPYANPAVPSAQPTEEGQ